MPKVLIIRPGVPVKQKDIFMANIVLTAATVHTLGVQMNRGYTHYAVTKNRYGPADRLIPRERIDSLDMDQVNEILELFGCV
jgi:hypothetical protein